MYKKIPVRLLIFIQILILLFMMTACNAEIKNDAFVDSIKENILSSNILVVKQDESENSFTYSYGFGGVVFKQTNNKYFVLTAYHCVKELTNSSLLVLVNDEKRYNDLDTVDKVGASNYYSRFPNATLEYYNNEYDLAVLSFESEKELEIIKVSQSLPEKSSIVASISSPKGYERNMISLGKVISKEPVAFGDNDGMSQHKVIEHTAFIAEGSSGSALVNEKLELVGINLGGSTDSFGKFKKGKAMPCDKVLEFLLEFNV